MLLPSVFFSLDLLNVSFNDQQDHSLQDYIETSLITGMCITLAGITTIIIYFIIDLINALTQFLTHS